MTYGGLDWVGGLADPIAQLMRERVEGGATPSAAYTVFGPDGVPLLSGGFGRVDEAGTPATIDTGYRIASCTKSFTAATVLSLCAAGVLSLDAPVTDYVDVGELVLTGVAASEVTVPTLGMLLSMSGGLPTDDAWADRQESSTQAEFDALVRPGLRLVSMPGTAFEYSNLGFALLGRAIEAATGLPFVRVAQERIIDPLGLEAVGFDTRTPAPDGLATGYVRRDGTWIPQPVTAPGSFSAIGGVFATARELSRWAAWLAAGFRGDSSGPLDGAARRLMQQAHRAVPHTSAESTSPGTGYGYGLFVETDAAGRRLVSHSGGYPGFSSHMRWHPSSGLGVVVLENGRYSGAWEPARAALDLLLEVAPRTGFDAGEVWPETLAARDAVERLAREWSDAEAVTLFAANVELDEPLARRAAELRGRAAEIGLPTRPAMLAASEPSSESGAHLAWTMHGTHGALRCEIRLTPHLRPRVQTLTSTLLG